MARRAVAIAVCTLAYVYLWRFPVAGIFLNDDINIVKAACDTVVSAEHDPALRRADVARYVLKMYDRGVVDPSNFSNWPRSIFEPNCVCAEIQDFGLDFA